MNNTPVQQTAEQLCGTIRELQRVADCLNNNVLPLLEGTNETISKSVLINAFEPIRDLLISQDRVFSTSQPVVVVKNWKGAREARCNEMLKLLDEMEAK